MSFEEPGSVAWLYEGDKKVDDPNTDTKQEDISRSVYIKVAKMPDIGSES